MVRYNPNINEGLNSKQVEQRISDGLVNYNTMPITKSIKKIIFSNTFTLFNFLNICLGIAVLLTGSYRNLLFIFVIFANTSISIIQEIRSKLITDKLSLISQSKITVIRDGKEENINENDIVLDDLILFKPGNQVVTDSIIIDGYCEVNESCITGESENIYKKVGDMLYSGSFIVENRAIAKVEHIGADNYTSIITKDAKYIKKVNSELMHTLTTVIKFISIIIVPVGLLLFYHQYNLLDNTANQAILNTVAALIGMIPDGLILLTSTVLAVSSIRLAQNKVLVQELFCIETLARVDTLCIDKTGTITEGYMEVADIIPVDTSISYIENKLKDMVSVLDNDNATMDALYRRYKSNIKIPFKNRIPFSSVHKYSAIETDKTYIIGAPTVLVKDKKLIKKITDLSKKNRVIVLCESHKSIVNKVLPNDIKVIAIVLLKDKIRLKAKDTLRYFRDQDVDVKIISGDSSITVMEIAESVGLSDAKAIDLYNMDIDKIPAIVDDYNIFARVTPEQKKVIIESLKKKKHTVAMIGDGVNDVLALKASDCSIAMASGSDAARNVSELVLLNSNFDSIPKILNEGRRSINNIERSSSLFLTKTLYASILAIIFIIIDSSYPFLPIQLSLYNLVTIGIPSIILALEPNNKRIKSGSFLLRVLSKAIPTSISVVICLLLSMYLGEFIGLPTEELSTMSTFILIIIGFRMIYKISVPFNEFRSILYIFLLIFTIVVSIVFKDWFCLVPLSLSAISLTVGISLLGIIIFGIVEKIFDTIEKKHNL